MQVFKKIAIGNWAKPGQDLRDGDLIEILDEGKEVENPKFGKRNVFSIATKNGIKSLTFNQTTINNLIDAFGAETKQWVGKTVKVWIIKQNVGGLLRNVIYLTAPDWEFTESGFVPPAKK
jgi:hypothetical protein